MPARNQDIILYKSKSSLLVILLFGIAQIAITLFALWSYISNREWQPLMVALFFAIGACYTFFSARKFAHVPLLIINTKGIYTPHTSSSIFSTWDEIVALYAEYSGKQRAFCVDDTPEGLANVHERIGLSPFDRGKPQQILFIQEGQLPIPVEQLLDQIRERFADQLQQYHIEVRD